MKLVLFFFLIALSSASFSQHNGNFNSSTWCAFSEGEEPEYQPLEDGDDYNNGLCGPELFLAEPDYYEEVDCDSVDCDFEE
jgi:hypothetical protein